MNLCYDSHGFSWNCNIKTDQRTDLFEMRECIKRLALAFSWPLLGSIYWTTSIFNVFYKSTINGPTDGTTDRPTDGRTDRPNYRDARTHLKRTFCMVSLNPELLILYCVDVNIRTIGGQKKQSAQICKSKNWKARFSCQKSIIIFNNFPNLVSLTCSLSPCEISKRLSSCSI